MEVALRYAAGHKCLVAEGFLERDSRHAPDTQARFDCALDSFSVLQLEHYLELGQDAVHGSIESLPGAGTGLAHDPRGVNQISVAERALLGKTVIRSTKDD